MNTPMLAHIKKDHCITTYYTYGLIIRMILTLVGVCQSGLRF